MGFDILEKRELSESADNISARIKSGEISSIEDAKKIFLSDNLKTGGEQDEDVKNQDIREYSQELSVGWEKELEEKKNLEEKTLEFEDLKNTLQDSESFKYFGAEINNFLVSQEDNLDNPNETSAEKLKRKIDVVTKLKDDLQKIHQASRVTEMGVTQEFAESFGGIIWEDFNNSVKSSLLSGKLDVGKILEAKKKISESIKSEFELAQKSEKLLEDQDQINRSATHLIESGLSPNDLDNDKLIRLLQKRTGSEFKQEETKNYLSQKLLDFKLSVSDKYQETITENTNEAEEKFQNILDSTPNTGFKSQDEFADYIQNSVNREMSDFFKGGKLPDEKWNNLRDHFMIPSANEHWDKYLENGKESVNKKLESALSEAGKKDFQTKEELYQFLQETTNELSRDQLVPNDFWDHEIADPFHAKVNLLWEQKEGINEGHLEAVKDAMNHFKLSKELLRGAKPRTESDFIRLGKDQLKEKFGHVFGKIPDDQWNMMMKAYFYPKIKRRIKANEGVVGSLMSSLSALNGKEASECKSAQEYIDKFKKKFELTKGAQAFGLVPNDVYDKLSKQYLLKKGRLGWLENEKSENQKINKAKSALNPQNIVGTVHHFVKSKGIKNPSAADFQKSSTKALASQFGLSKAQIGKLSGDLMAYAQQARQEYSRRKSRAMSEVNRYGNDVSKVENFSEEDLNEPINLQNPNSSGFYRKMVGQVGDMEFDNVDDWYLVSGEALRKMDGIRQQKLKEASRDKVLEKDESMDSTVSKIQGLMKNISLSDEILQRKEMRTEADFFALGKKELRKEHGQLTDKQWDEQMEKVFYPQMKAQLKAKENVVSQSMRSASISLSEEDFANINTAEDFSKLAKKRFSETHGQKIFGLIPDENYDRLKNKYLNPQITKLWQNFEKKKSLRDAVEGGNEGDEKIPELAKKWGFNDSEKFKEISDGKGFSRLTELTSQNQYGLTGLDSTHMKNFGPFLINLMGDIDKNKFDQVKIALKEASLSSITDKKEQFLNLTQILVSVGYENNSTDVKNIVGKTSGIDTRFNNFFGNTILDLRSKDLEEKSDIQTEFLEDSLDGGDEDGEALEDEMLDEDSEFLETLDSESFDDLENKDEDNSSSQQSQASGNQNSGDFIEDEKLEDEKDLDLLKSDLKTLEDLEESTILEEKSGENLENKIFADEDLEDRSSEFVKVQTPEEKNISLEEISLDESQNQAQNIDEDITDDEEDSEKMLEEILEDEDLEENLQTEEGFEENLEDEESDVEDEDLDSENLEEEISVNEEDLEAQGEEQEDLEDLEDNGTLDDVEETEDAENISEEILESEENLEKEVQEDAQLKEKSAFAAQVESDQKRSENLKIKREKEAEEEKLEENSQKEIMYENSENIQKLEDLDDENQGNKGGKKQWGSKVEEEKTIQEIAEQKLKNKELAKKLITGKSMVLLSDEDLATVFNRSYEWDLTGDSDLTLLQIIKMAHITLEVTKGGKKIGLSIKVSQSLLHKKILKSEILLDNFISTAVKVQGLKNIIIRGVKEGRLMGIWGTAFGNIPFKIEM